MGIRKRREKYILPMLKQLNEDESIVTYDIENAPRNAMRNAKATWLKPTKSDYICVLQDDLLLCDNFKEVAEKCVEQFPASIFSFYQPRLKFEDRSPETPFVKINGFGVYGPANIIPSSLVPLIFHWGDINYGKNFPHDDTVIGFFAKTHDIPVMSTIPCPIQHLGCNDSSLGYNNKNKVSKTFKEHIDISEFNTSKYVKSKLIPNTEIKPEGGYLLGDLKRMF